MEYATLSDGTHSLRVSRICLGTWQFGDTTGTFNGAKEMTSEAEDAVVAAALDAGINFFDTAEGYAGGKSERALGRALRATGRPREDYVIASKVLPSNLSPLELRKAAERSLEALGTHIDLYQIHWANWDVPIEDTLKALEELRNEGKIKMIGVSNFGKRDLTEAVAHKIPIVTNQLPYSLLMRQIETAGIVDVCQQQNCGILCYSPLSQGLLTGKYAEPDECPDGLTRSRFFMVGRSPLCRHKDAGCEEELFAAIAKIKEIAAEVEGTSMAAVSLAWTLAQPGVVAVVVGASKPEQATRNAEAASIKLSPEIVQRLSEASEPVRLKLGENPDMWGDECRYR